MPKPTFSMNEAGFKAVLERYAEESSKTIRDTYNARMLDVIIKAYMRTPQIKPDRLQSRLAQMVQMGYRTESGTPKTPMTRAAMLVLRNLARGGKKAIGGQALHEAGQRLLLAKLRAAKFFKSGWVPALRTFNIVRAALRNKPPRPNLGQEQTVRGRPKGSGRAATEIVHPMAIAENTIEDIDDVGRAALDAAFRIATARMEHILRGELEYVKKKHWDGKVVR